MKKSDILKALLIIADQIGEVIHASVYESWVSVKVRAEDGSEHSLEYNILKEAKTEEKKDGD